MKLNPPVWLLAGAAVIFALAVLDSSDELLVASLLMVGMSVVAYIAQLRARAGKQEVPAGVEARLQELERRLGLTEGELDVANEPLQRLRAEREFDRALAAGPGAPGAPGAPLGPR